MKKQTLFLVNLLIILLLLTGCALIEGEEGEHRERLDPADWPTPRPAEAALTPTPFPKVTLPSNSASSAQAEATSAPAEAEASAETDEALPQSGTEEDLSALLEQLDDDQVAALLQQLGAGEDAAGLLQQLAASGQADELIQQLSAGGDLNALLEAAGAGNTAGQPPAANGLGGLIPVATLNIQADTATLRQQPDPSAAVLDELERGDLGGVLGRDESGTWLFVVTIDYERGWLPLSSARVVGDLTALPVLPSGILATLSRPAASPSTAPAAPVAVPVQPIDLASLKPVATAKVNISLLNMRQRPGPDFPVVGTVPQDEEVQVLALNQRQDWVLITATGQTTGWVWRDYLALAGSLENAPQVRTLDPASDQPAGQPAPVAPISSGTGASEAAAASQPGNASAPAVVEAAVPVALTGDGPALPAATLAPITTAKINLKVDGRRGPGTSYGAVTNFTIDETVTVYATNQAGDWVVVQGPNGRTGWVPLATLDLSSPLAGAAPVVTGWVDSNEIEVKRGPGIYYETTGVLAIRSMVSLIALNEGRSWALVETFAGGRGWVPLRFLEVTGSLEAVPEVAAPAVASGQPQALPSAPAPLTGKLVFQTASGGDIMMINSDGTGLRRLTSGIDPVLSPDGQQVAFTRWEGDIGTLWTMNIDGSNERAVLGGMRKAKGPDWSPDGSQIILNFQQGGYVDERQDCVALEPGSSPRPPRNATDIKVVTDGKGNLKLCFTLPPDPHWSLRLVNLSDASFEDLYGGMYAFRPAWDPAQPWRVVSDAGNGLLAVDINRDDYRQSLTNELLDSSPAFSPDGRFIAVTTATQGGYDIFRLNADGGGRIRLTETPLWVPVQPESEGEVWNYVSPVWSPDGSQIAFLTDREGRWEIWVMEADGSNQRPMFLPEVNEGLNIEYNFVDERVLSWR